MKSKNIHPKDIDKVFTFYREENNGKEPTECEQVTIFNHRGYGIVSVNGFFGAINRNGEVIIPLDYENLIDFNLDDEFIVAKKDERWGFINWKNEIVIPFEYSSASIFDEIHHLSKVCKDGKYGFINRENRIKIPLDYDSTTSIYFNKIGVLKSGKWGVINTNNQQIIKYKYDFAQCIVDNIYYVGKEVDEKVEGYDFDRDLLKFNNGNLIKFGLIDEEENLLMDYESYNTTSFYGNNKVLAFDYHKNENYLFDIISKEKIYAPANFNGDEKTNYLKCLLK